MTGFQLPADAIAALGKRLEQVGCEKMAPGDAIGRVLASDLLADRDSPPLDVSAMDGYGFRRSDAIEALNSGGGWLAVSHTIPAGSSPDNPPAGSAVKIFTGAPVPNEVDCVVKREDTDESQQAKVRIREVPDVGKNIRFKGENSKAGDVVLAAGAELSATRVAGLAAFVGEHVNVRRRVRVAVINTGDELVSLGQSAEPWQIRDSNGPFLAAWLAKFGWVDVVCRRSLRDDFDTVKDSISEAKEQADAVLLTGGVSMGDADYVPGAIESLGGETVFHRLPIRPGKPVLGACIDGKLILGLPGNPVSVAVTARAIGLPLLQLLAGRNENRGAPLVHVVNPDTKTLGLVWHRLARINSSGDIELVGGRGSGDIVALAASDGVVVLPPGESGSGPWPWLTW
ncbi:MAG: molybdopterin molybdotransferase MoeA [Aureliella sp.]